MRESAWQRMRKPKELLLIGEEANFEFMYKCAAIAKVPISITL